MIPGQVLQVLLVGGDADLRELAEKALSEWPAAGTLYWVSQLDLALVRAQDIQPRIILLDVSSDEQAGLQLIGQIAARLPRVAVIALVPADAIARARAVVLAGAGAFVTLPLEPAQLLASLRQVLSQPASPQRISGQEAGRGRVIAFIGPKGGAGRTTLAINTAISLLQYQSQPVVLVDADYAAPALDVALNLRSPLTIADLLPKIARLDADLLDPVLLRHSSGIRLLLAPPPGAMQRLPSSPQVQQVLGWLRRLFPWVIVDVGLPLDEMSLAVLDGADRIVQVAMPEMVGIRNGRLMLDQFCERGYPDRKVWLVLNRANLSGGLPLAAVEERLDHRVRHLIPDDQALATETINRGLPFVVAHARSPIARACLALARDLVRSFAETTEVAQAAAPALPMRPDTPVMPVAQMLAASRGRLPVRSSLPKVKTAVAGDETLRTGPTPAGDQGPEPAAADSYDTGDEAPALQMMVPGAEHAIDLEPSDLPADLPQAATEDSAPEPTAIWPGDLADRGAVGTEDSAPEPTAVWPAPSVWAAGGVPLQPSAPDPAVGSGEPSVELGEWEDEPEVAGAGLEPAGYGLAASAPADLPGQPIELPQPRLVPEEFQTSAVASGALEPANLPQPALAPVDAAPADAPEMGEQTARIDPAEAMHAETSPALSSAPGLVEAPPDEFGEPAATGALSDEAAELAATRATSREASGPVTFGGSGGEAVATATVDALPSEASAPVAPDGPPSETVGPVTAGLGMPKVAAQRVQGWRLRLGAKPANPQRVLREASVPRRVGVPGLRVVGAKPANPQGVLREASTPDAFGIPAANALRREPLEPVELAHVATFETEAADAAVASGEPAQPTSSESEAPGVVIATGELAQPIPAESEAADAAAPGEPLRATRSEIEAPDTASSDALQVAPGVVPEDAVAAAVASGPPAGVRSDVLPPGPLPEPTPSPDEEPGPGDPGQHPVLSWPSHPQEAGVSTRRWPRIAIVALVVVGLALLLSVPIGNHRQAAATRSPGLTASVPAVAVANPAGASGHSVTPSASPVPATATARSGIGAPTARSATSTPVPATAAALPTATAVEAQSPAATPAPSATAAPIAIPPTHPPAPTQPPATRAILPTPAPTARPGSFGLSVPAYEAPAPNAVLSGNVTFRWLPTGPLPQGAGYEVVCWNPGENPAGARGMAPTTTGTSQVIDIGVVYDSHQITGTSLYWAVLVVQRSPYQRLTQPANSNPQLLTYRP